jgi:3-oxoacyl-[acyl-carrier-protein] synthase III
VSTASVTTRTGRAELPAVYISGIAHRCGDWLPIEEAPGLDRDTETVAFLKNLGIRRYSSLRAPLPALAERCIPDTLERAACRPSDVDATIFWSTTFDTYRQHSEVPIALAALSLGDAVPYGVFHNQCTNHSQALLLAQTLCATGQASRVLVFGHDALDEQRVSRVLDNRTSVYSDAFVSFLVSTDVPVSGFRVDGIRHRHCPSILQEQGPERALQFITKYSQTFQQVCRNLYADLELRPDDFAWLITANYNRSVIRNLADLAGVPAARLFVDNVSRYAHCFSADHLIALETLEEARTLDAGQRFLLAAVGGFFVFSAVALTRVGSRA